MNWSVTHAGSVDSWGRLATTSSVRLLSLIALWFHLLAAMIWIGGMVFLALVVVPITRQPAYRTLASALMSQSGKRFRWIGWGCIGVLLLTGIVNLATHGFTWADVWEGQVFAGRFGHAFAAKLLCVSLVLILSVIHDFFIGPRATVVGQSAPDSPEALRLRRQASWMGRLNLLLSLVIVALAVVMIRG